MQLIVLGLNHKTAPVEVREGFNFSADRIARILLQTLVKHLAGDGYKTEYFYNLSGVNCVRHLFKVASSLDSLVIGEGQILSQIKNAPAKTP